MFSSLFSSKNKEGTTQKTVVPSGVISRVKSFAGKVSMVLGLASVSSGAMSGPSTPEIPIYNPEASVLESPSSGKLSSVSVTHMTLPSKAPVIQEQKAGQLEPVSIQPKIRLAVAQKG